jgi:tetratricopeptide (TPR) repeat protein
MLRSAMEAAERALTIDSTIVEARTAIAYANTLEFQNREAERHFAEAINLDSSFATAHFWHALLLTQQGLQSEALREIEKAMSLEPASLIINTGRGQILYAKRDYTQAADALQRALRLDPTFQVALTDLARVLIEQGRSAEAIPILERIRDTPGVRRSEKLGVLAYAYARAGRNSDAMEIAAHALSGRTPVLSPSGPLATALYLLGERKKAIEILGATVAGYDLWLAHSVAAAPYDALRKDPQAAPIFAKIEAR